MLFAIIAALGFLGKYIAELKGRNPLEGFLPGTLLGLLGILIEALFPRK
jgi:VIT1/CCC1 family predicted Fe2+/Mn2+ transporter